MTHDAEHAQHERFMRRAIELSRASLKDGGGPFGAVVVMRGEIVGEGSNHVTGSNDPTAHAEIVAIRDACARLGTFALEGATLYASCEPCPMCLAAIYWARVGRIVYANTTSQAAEIGFDDEFVYRQLSLPAEERALATQRLPSDDARSVFAEWDRMDDKRVY